MAVRVSDGRLVREHAQKELPKHVSFRRAMEVQIVVLSGPKNVLRAGDQACH